MTIGNFGRNVAARATRRQSFLSNSAFSAKFKSLLNQRAAKKNVLPGMDMARGLGQAKAAVQGRTNTPQLKKRTPLSVQLDPVAAALQHSVRNRSVEQGGNATTATTSAGSARGVQDSVRKLLLNRMKGSI